MRAVTLLTLILSSAGLAASTDCPDRWIAFSGSCYLIGHNVRYSFMEAECHLYTNNGLNGVCGTGASCLVRKLFCRQSLGAHLVHVDSSVEANFLKSEFRAYKNDSFWLGLTDMKTEGTWQWYDTGNAPAFLDWFPGEPNSYQGDEDCALFWEYSNFEWVDAPCDALAEPICEIVMEPPVDSD